MKCIRCGSDQMSKICQTCMKSWMDRRLSACEKIEAEIGKLCPENHEEFKKRLKKIEKKGT